MDPASFNECLYFLMKTTLRWILEVVTLAMQVPSSQLTSPALAVIYGRDIFYEYWHCRIAEMGMQQNANSNLGHLPMSESLIFDGVIRISRAFSCRKIDVYVELRPP